MKKNIFWIILIIILIIGFAWYFIISQQASNEIIEDQLEENLNGNVNVQIENDSTFNPEPEEPNDSASVVEEVTLSASSFEYDQKEIRVPLGSTVQLTLNVEEGFHDWVIDEFGAATAQMSAGNNQTIEFVADQTGEFEYYCSVGQHRQMGMVGKLIVE